MITQCPKCQKTQEIPDHYKGQLVKCLHCKEQFAAWEYKDPADIVLPNPPVHPEYVPIPWREIFYGLLRIVAVIWFIAAAVGGIMADYGYSMASNEYYTSHPYTDYQSDVLCAINAASATIQCLLAASLFCLASIAKK